MNEIGMEYLLAEREGKIPNKRCCTHTDFLHGPTERKYCQFGLNEELINWKDKDYCIYHLPAEAKRMWGDVEKKNFNNRVLNRIIYWPRTGQGLDDPYNDFSKVVFPEQTDLREARFGNTKVFFDNAVFMGGVSFNGCRFASRVSFKNAKFGSILHDQIIDFSNARFAVTADFNDTAEFTGIKVFAQKVIFDNVDFGSGLPNFNNAQFNCKSISFENAFNRKHGRGLIFNNTRFSGDFSCRGASFFGDINFSNAFFRGEYANFEAKVLGTGSLSFEKVEFKVSRVSFKNLMFPEGGASFREAVFENSYKNFSGTKFHSSGVNFTKVNFGDKDCIFKNMECHGDIYFTKAIWGEAQINFDGLKIGVPTEYYNCEPDSQILKLDFTTNSITESQKFEKISFNGAEINAEVSFENREFLNNPSFDNCVFHYAPDFSGARMHPSTNFKTTVFKDIRYEVSERYNLLKTLMKTQSNKEEHQKFYILKQKCLSADPNIPWIEWLLLYLYGAFSNYGSDYIRVLKCLLWSFLFSFLFYFVIGYFFLTDELYNQVTPIEYVSNILRNSFNLTLKQYFWPSHAFNEISVCVSASCDMKHFYKQEKTSLWLTFIAVLSVLHLVFNLCMISLFFISLNWRFKRGEVV